MKVNNFGGGFIGIASHGNNWSMNTNGSSQIRFVFSDSTNVTTGFSIPIINGFFKVIAQTSGSDIILTFQSSSDGITYTNLGTPLTATGKAGLIGSASAPLRVGGDSGGTSIVGDIYKAEFYDSTNALLFNCEPSRYNRAVSATTFTSTTGETYTINVATAATGFKSMMVDQTMIQGNGTSTGMQAASATINTLQFTQYNVWRKYSNAITAVGVVNEFGSSVSAGVGLAYAPNEIVNTESTYVRSNIGLNGSSWVSNSILLKFSTFRGNIADTREQSLATNNVNNTFNADQSPADNTTAIIATGDNLLARNNAASLWMNAIWVAGHLNISTDSVAEQTAMYNYISPLVKIV